MKLAVLLQCHKKVKQVNRLLSTLEHLDVDVLVHVDRKSE